jgi:thioredoxin:protein disulfide reductase
MIRERVFPSIALAILGVLPAQGAPRPFNPVKDVGMVLARGVLTVTLPPGVHLKRRFFKVALASGPGTVTAGPLPPADGRDDTGDPVWHGTLRVPLRGEGLKDPVVLRITYQPCTEGAGSVCYLPQHRLLSVAATEIPVGIRPGP